MTTPEENARRIAELTDALKDLMATVDEIKSDIDRHLCQGGYHD